MANEQPTEAALAAIGRAIERARAKRAAAGAVSPFPEEAQDGLDVTEHLAERVKGRRETQAAAVEVPPELVQPLQEWHGLVKDEARRRIEEE